jgi:hypothetical protein
MQSVGFKEWALVDEALRHGRQSVLLRKGGIAEGRNGFQFRHREFFLFPTFFHEQLGRTRLTNAVLPAQVPNEIAIRSFLRVEETRLIDDWEIVRAMAPLHILNEPVVRERFDYEKTPGVQVAFVRAFRVEPVWRFADAPRYGGCRSWVNLPPLPEGLALRPVLSEAEQEQRRNQFRAITAALTPPGRTRC